VDLLSSWQRSTITPGGMMPHKPTMTITNLPTDVLSCIIQHLQQDIGQRDQTLDDVAALRSVCRSLRLATDLHVTHVNFHARIDVDELRSVTRRFLGEQTGTCLEVAGLWVGSAPGKCKMSPARFDLAQNTADLHSHFPLCNIIAGLHSVTLQQLGPDTAHSNLEALSTLKHLRNLDTP
jgi:F-box domain